jgi:NAD(P)-dependent dehydrogenase (short-subunit alcohol dehydrogenase family)
VDNALDDEFRVLAFNINGTFRMAKHAVQHVVPKGHGRILIVSATPPRRSRPSTGRR